VYCVLNAVKGLNYPTPFRRYAVQANSLTHVVIYDNMSGWMTRRTRPASWIKAALKEFRKFPEGAQSICLAALTIAAEGEKADIAKTMLGMGSGVFEIALLFQGDAFRVIYAVQIADEIWVVHAFQKKSTQGIKTPQREIDLIKDRLKKLKEALR
jgi:phage-related protein